MKSIKLSDKQKKAIIEEMSKKILALKSTDDLENIKLTAQDDLKEIEPPEIHYTANAFLKMQALIDACPQEIQWHGLVSRMPNSNIFIVEDILIYPQYVSASLVDTDDETYAKWLTDQMADPARFKKLRMHGHSHVRMAVNPSSIDARYQQDMLKNVQDFYIFAIGNKTNDFYHAIYDVKNNLMFDKRDIILKIILPTGQLTDVWGKAMVERFTKPFPPHKSSTTSRETTDQNDPFEYIGFPKEQLKDQIDWREVYNGLE